jgi:hypothetical protein
MALPVLLLSTLTSRVVASSLDPSSLLKTRLRLISETQPFLAIKSCEKTKPCSFCLEDDV